MHLRLHNSFSVLMKTRRKHLERADSNSTTSWVPGSKQARPGAAVCHACRMPSCRTAWPWRGAAQRLWFLLVVCVQLKLAHCLARAHIRPPFPQAERLYHYPAGPLPLPPLPLLWSLRHGGHRIGGCTARVHRGLHAGPKAVVPAQRDAAGRVGGRGNAEGRSGVGRAPAVCSHVAWPRQRAYACSRTCPGPGEGCVGGGRGS